MPGKSYDIIIIGGGITGASVLYLLSSYTNIKSVLLIEKYNDLARLNSNSANNAQTLHFGDIETNYSLEQAKNTKQAATRILRYLDKVHQIERERLIKKCQKMVLAVGEFEIDLLDKIYYSGIKDIFPKLKKIGKNELSRIEPNTVRKRDPDQRVSALLSDNGHMVDFGKLTHSFVADAKKNRGVKIDVLFNTTVKQIKHVNDEFDIDTNKGGYSANFVVVAAGTYSLFFAKSMGYDQNLSMLSVGGNFYSTPKVLNGKVYRVQLGGIPFAAVHGDPDINNQKITRFGPTVTLPLQLERHNNSTFGDYLRTFDFDIQTMISLKRILFNRDIRRIISKNILYDIPIIGRYSFLKMEAELIVPALKYAQLRFAKHVGGIRPQIIDENKKALVLGAGKIKEDGIIFNITPSPGASSCLEAALSDIAEAIKYLDKDFEVVKFERELGKITNKDILKSLG